MDRGVRTSSALAAGRLSAYCIDLNILYRRVPRG